MKILKLTPRQSQELIALNNQSGKHLNPCDYGAGISVQADFDEATYSAHKAYLDAEGITPTNILVTDEEKLVITNRSIINTSIANYSALPSSGSLLAGDIYSYNGSLVQVIQDHQRTIYPPNETPALFSVYRANTEDMDWVANEQVIAGDKRSYGGKTYQCIQSHQTLSSWTPDVTPALWKEVIVVVDIPVWVQPTGAHDAYLLGAKVHFPTISDPIYESLINANVWSPSVLPSAWKLV